MSRYSKTCIFCERVLSSNLCFEVHIHSHTGERPYICEYCGATFNSKANEITHVKNIHLGIKYPCPNCGKIYNAQSNLINHRKSCTGESVESSCSAEKIRNDDENKKKVRATAYSRVAGRNVKRVVRSKRTSRFKPVKKKPLLVIKKEEVEDDELPPSPSSFIDQDQQFVETDFIKQETLKPPVYNSQFRQQITIFAAQLLREEKQEHERMAGFFLHLNRYNPQDSCFSDAYPPKSDVTLDAEPVKAKVKKQRHWARKVAPKSKVKRPKNKASRAKTGKSCYRRGRYQCRQCGKFYSSNGNLTKHERIHAGLKRYTCCFCQKGFVERCNLIRHIAAMHQNPETGPQRSVGAFRCGFCGATFAGGILKLTRHILADHGERVAESKTTTMAQVKEEGSG